MRQPDQYGVAVGDLVAGTCVSIHKSTVGEVIQILPRPWGAFGNRYLIRVGEICATGEPIERVIHDHPSIVAPAGEPIVCATCETRRHETAGRFVDCLIAHLRADAERAAVGA